MRSNVSFFLFFLPFFGCFPKFLDLWVMGSSFEKPRLEQRKLEDKAKIKARFVLSCRT